MNTDTQILNLLEQIVKVNSKILQHLKNQAPKLQRITLTEFYSKYIDLQKENLSQSSLEIIKYGVKHFNEYLNREIYLDEITSETVLEFRNYLFQKAKSKVYWRGLKAFFNYAVKLNYLSESYFNIDYIRVQQIKKDAISSEKLLIIISLIPNQVIRYLVEFTYLTGLRLGEAVALLLSDIDFTEKTLTVGSETLTTKSRKQRIIPLTDRALQIAIECKPTIISFDKSNNLFRKSDGNKFSKDYISKTFQKAVKKSGLDLNVTYHGLRHSFATNLAQNGTPINTVKELMGHSSVKVTEDYFNHESLESLRSGIQKINNQ